MRKLSVSLFGPLKIINAEGRDVTPKAPRIRALFALLAEPPIRKRSRRWLAAHIWSDKDFKQAGMSLRNALGQLRKALEVDGMMIGADRTDIWLIAEHFECTPPEPVADRARPEFLEGLDIRDAAFDDWVRDARSAHATSPRALPPVDTVGRFNINVLSRVGVTTSRTCQITAGVIADQIGQNLEDLIGSARSETDLRRGDLEITTHMSETQDRAVLSARVVHGPTDTVLYSAYRNLTKAGAVLLTDQEVAGFSHTVALRALAKLPEASHGDREEVIAIGLARQSRRQLFSYRPGGIKAAGRLFERAFDADPEGIYLAWQAFQRAALVMEEQYAPTPELLEECTSLMERAVRLSPESAKTHALISLVQFILFRDTATALVSAEAGLSRNPNCLYSRQALAMTAGAMGDKEAAYRATSFCRPALVDDDARHLWDLYHGLVCLSTGRFSEALDAMKSAAIRCPSFKAPHRQLIALHTWTGNREAARHHHDALSDLEDGLSMDNFLRNPNYPVATLRETGLLDQDFEYLR